MRLRNLLFAIYVVCCLLAMAWPGYGWFVNSDKLGWFGMPLSLLWVVGWVLATFGVLVIYHVTDRGEG